MHSALKLCKKTLFAFSKMAKLSIFAPEKSLKIAFLVVLNFFLVQKLIFLPFLKLKKMCFCTFEIALISNFRALWGTNYKIVLTQMKYVVLMVVNSLVLNIQLKTCYKNLQFLILFLDVTNFVL